MMIAKGHPMKARWRLIRFLCLLALWLGLGLQAHAQTDTVTYVYTDPQGTPLVKADTSGNVIAKYDYTPYGNSIASLGSAPNGPGYTGHVNDPETGLVYMQARYYQLIGRFPNPDPLGPVAGDIYSFNRYAYADNNPIVHDDPTGMFPGDVDDFEHSVYPVQVTFFGSGGDGGGGNSTPSPPPQSSAAPSGVKQFLVGVSKPVINLLDDIAAVMGDSEASNAPPLTPSNPSQAVGMMVSGAVITTAEIPLTDGESVEASVATGAGLGESMGMLREAATRKGNYGLGQATAQEAEELGRSWVGSNYRVASDGRTLVSENGMRTFRPPSLKNSPRAVTGMQANFERLENVGGRPTVIGNGHLDIIQ